MIYNSNIGELFDTLYFGVIYFNKEIVKKKTASKAEDQEKLFEYYDEIKDEIGELSSVLAPFYFYDEEITPFALEFFTAYQNNHFPDFNEFIKMIEESISYKNILFKMLLRYPKEENLKEALDRNDIGFIHKTVEALKYPTEIKYQIMFILTNIDYSRELLKESLLKIYKVVQKLHANHSKLIKAEFKTIKQNESIKLYQELLKTEESNIVDATITYSLLNKFLLYSNKNSESLKLFILLGIKQRMKRENIMDCDGQDIRDILKVFSEPLRMDILDKLLEYNELTLSQLSRLLFASTTTIQRHLQLLMASRMILISKQETIQIYYALNKNYISSVHKVIDGYFDKFQVG